MKKRTVPAFLAVVLSLTVVGCVPYQTYDETKLEYEKVLKAHEDLSAKYNRIVQSLSLGGEEGLPENLLEELEKSQKLVSQLEAQLHDVSRGPVARFPDDLGQEIQGITVENGKLILGEAILFNEGSASLKTGGKTTLDAIAAILKRDFPGEAFHIVGHTDNVPLQKTKRLHEYNVNLGYKRAYTVFKYFQMEHAIAEQQFVLHSYGFTRPIDPATQDTKEGRQKNRRVEILRAGFKF